MAHVWSESAIATLGFDTLGMGQNNHQNTVRTALTTVFTKNKIRK